ncbi:MAG: polysaccharide biosynthesis tyrosine autokinase [Gemmatimonadetes bacterium]|nr:polysaccharide biosynthesis tyrosine autokinase [Gemmatimonadota bacterium]
MNYDSKFNRRAKVALPQGDYDIAEDQLDFLQYWNVVYREKWGILGLAIAVCLITTVFVFDMTPIYRATATLLIEAKQVSVVSIEEVYGIDSSKREYYQTQFEILNSRQLAEDVINKLRLTRTPSDSLDWRRWIPFLPPPETPTEEQRWQGFVASFQKAVEIQPIRNTQMVKISFESPDPELTYKVANELGNTYIENQLDARLQLTQKAANWLTIRLEGMRGDLERSETALQAFREREGLIDISGVQTLTAKEINEVTTQLVEARKRTAEAKGLLDSLGTVGPEYESRWETSPGVLADSVTQQLKAREVETSRFVSELSQRYGPKHPKLIAARSNLNNAVSAYRNQVVKVVGGVGKNYQQALTDEQSLELALARGKNQIQSINRKNYQLSQLEREVDTTRELYNLFFTRFRETSEAGFEAANARFVDLAVRPFTPVKPKKTQMVLIAGLLSMLLGIALAFLKLALDNTIKVGGDIEEKLGQPVVGVLPIMKDVLKGKDQASLAYLDKEQKGFGEAVRTMRTGVILSGVDNPLKVLVVTSSVPNEGKTTLALSLALSLGQMGNVVLLDADMRKPSIANDCNLPKGVSGLSEIIAGTEDLKNCIHRMAEGGIDLIPAGIVPPNPLELLSSRRFAKLIEELREKYDRVIIDSAPTQAVSDSLVLSDLADGVIFVVKADSTTTQVALGGIQRLLRVNANLVGVVLNQFDSEGAVKYGYYGKDYYDYYGYGSSKGYS